MLSDEDVVWLTAVMRQYAIGLSAEDNVVFQFLYDVELGRGSTSWFDARLHASMLDNLGDSYVSNDGLTVWSHDDNQLDPSYVVSIGLQGLVANDGRLDRDVYLALVLASMFHEMRHVEQFEIGAGREMRPDDMCSDVLWSLAASCGNRVFRKDNYSRLPHEIDAERIGILHAYDELCGLFDVDDAKLAMSQSLRYVTKRHIGPVGYRFCPLRFDESWFSGVLGKAMSGAVGHSRKIRGLFRYDCPDFAARYLSLNEQDRKAFLSLRTGTEQDAYLAKINVEFNDKERAFFDRDALLLPDTVPELLGGVLTKSVAVADERRPIEGVFFDDVTDDELQL